jgi:hypothetical protein
VDPESPDKLLPLDRLQEFKELTPTSLNPDITHGLPINLAGTLMTVTPLEKTMIVNNLPGAFDKGTVGAIALNDSAQHMLAVSEFTPVGAASQVGNNDNNNGIPEEENYDFIIPEAIVE